MTDLIPAGDRPVDMLDRLARLAALADVIGQVTDDTRTQLAERLDTLSADAGGKFTLRADSGRAVMAGGGRTVRVSDPAEFGRWLTGNDMGHLAERSREVRVIDQSAAVAAVAAAQAGEDVHVGTILWALALVDVWRVADDAVDVVTALPNVVVCDDRVAIADPDTGHLTDLPGLAVSVARETLQVRVDAKVRAAHRLELHGLLGLPGGDQ